MRKNLTIFFLPLLAGLLFSCKSLPPSVQTTVPSTKYIDKYGGLWMEMTSGEFNKRGYDCGDVIRLNVAGQSHEMPIVPNFRYVKSGKAALVLSEDAKKPLTTTIYYGDAASRWGIAVKNTASDKSVKWTPHDGITMPLPVVISMKEKGGYADQLLIYDLKRTNNRDDYAELSDEDFANFRVIRTHGMADSVLYRSSSPINPAIGRNTFVDKAAKTAGIKTVVNMADMEAAARKMDGWDKSYCATLPTVFLHMGVDATQPSFGDGVRDGIRFMLSHEPPYLLHCKEGQDRTGFLCAVLELLVGASLQEIADDYLRTFQNFYHVKADSRQAAFVRGDIQENLRTALNLKSLEKADLSKAAETYLLNVGLTQEEIMALRRKLSAE
ncbi:MAG: tyrosine-protein phosphatase [Victivallales bacterium]|nr:tyrosine-protein phosphatase [Victivallales bacterium]